MATIKTIKPSGGGDYTTLQAWEDWADDQASAAQWAECYTGGDLGEVIVSGWATAPDATNYPKIYAATNYAHDGTNSATGCYITVANSYNNAGIEIGIDYIRVEHIRFTLTHGANWINGIWWNGGHNATIDGCLFRYTGTPGAGTARGIGAGAGADTKNIGTIKNCIVYGTGSTQERGIQLSSKYNDATVTIYNNSVYNTQSKGISYYVDVSYHELTVTSTNNAAINCNNADFVGFGDTTGLSVTQTYCVSSDATADDWGGAGNQISKTAAACFDTPGTNVTPVENGPLHDTGTTIASVTTDAIGTSRPQGSAYDIGAIELITSTYQPRGTSLGTPFIY